MFKLWNWFRQEAELSQAEADADYWHGQYSRAVDDLMKVHGDLKKCQYDLQHAAGMRQFWERAANQGLDQSYVDFVRTLFAKRNEAAEGLMHAAAGLSGEAGEVLEIAKKHWVTDKPIDFDHLVEELGDSLFYWTAVCLVMGINPELPMAKNVQKLMVRYPYGYTDKAAIARADKAGAA